MPDRAVTRPLSQPRPDARMGVTLQDALSDVFQGEALGLNGADVADVLKVIDGPARDGLHYIVQMYDGSQVVVNPSEANVILAAIGPTRRTVLPPPRQPRAHSNDAWETQPVIDERVSVSPVATRTSRRYHTLTPMPDSLGLVAFLNPAQRARQNREMDPRMVILARAVEARFPNTFQADRTAHDALDEARRNAEESMTAQQGARMLNNALRFAERYGRPGMPGMTTPLDLGTFIHDAVAPISPADARHQPAPVHHAPAARIPTPPAPEDVGDLYAADIFGAMPTAELPPLNVGFRDAPSALGYRLRNRVCQCGLPLHLERSGGQELWLLTHGYKAMQITDEEVVRIAGHGQTDEGEHWADYPPIYFALHRWLRDVHTLMVAGSGGEHRRGVISNQGVRLSPREIVVDVRSPYLRDYLPVLDAEIVEHRDHYATLHADVSEWRNLLRRHAAQVARLEREARAGVAVLDPADYDDLIGALGTGRRQHEHTDRRYRAAVAAQEAQGVIIEQLMNDREAFARRLRGAGLTVPPLPWQITEPEPAQAADDPPNPAEAPVDTEYVVMPLGEAGFAPGYDLRA